MKTKTINTLLRLAFVAVFVLTVGRTTAQDKGTVAGPGRNVMTSSGTKPDAMISKAAPVSGQAQTNEVTVPVTFDDGTSVPMNAATKATYDAIPKLTSAEIASKDIDPKVMDAWVAQFVKWRADHPVNYSKALSNSERKIIAENGDVRQIYVAKHNAAYLANQRETIRNANNK